MELEFHNTAHLGDCLFHVHYLNKLIEKYENIKVIFNCNSSYHDQLNDFIIYPNNIKLRDIQQTTPQSIDCWITRDLPNKKLMLDKLNKDGLYDLFYVSFFKELSGVLGLESPIREPKDMLIHNNKILDKNDLSDEVDFLIINSSPLSGQFGNFDISAFDNVIKILREKGKVITTAPNSCGAPCTLDYGLTLMQIGNLSVYAKNIIAINTAPIIACFNIFNIDKFEKFLVLENAISYSYNNRIKNINKINDIILNF